MRLFIAAATLALATAAASAHDYKAGSIEIDHPWSRATPKGATVAAGYLKLTNKGSEPDRLIGGSSGVGAFEIHEMAMEQGVMKMRQLSNGIEIKPGETVELKPGSYHLMFVGIKQPLEKGQRVKGTLQFQKGGSVDVEYTVEAVGATPQQSGSVHNHGGH